MSTRASKPYGDTRDPSSEWHKLACETRDYFFPVQPTAGHTKQCDSCQGWPFLDTEPQTTHLKIESRSADTPSLLRVVVLEHYWECRDCSTGRPPIKCDWCCNEFPGLRCCNTSAHNNPDMWGLEPVEGETNGEDWAAAGLTCVKHLSIGCRTRWADQNHPADKVVEATCPACNHCVIFDRTEKFQKFVLEQHPRKCQGIPKHWTDLAKNERKLKKVFEEGGPRGSRGRRLMAYKDKAKDAIAYVYARFHGGQAWGRVESEQSISFKLDEGVAAAVAGEAVGPHGGGNRREETTPGLEQEDHQGAFAESLPALDHSPCHEELEAWLGKHESTVDDPELTWGLRRTESFLTAMPADTLNPAKRSITLLEDASDVTTMQPLSEPLFPNLPKRPRPELTNRSAAALQSPSYPLRKPIQSLFIPTENIDLDAAVHCQDSRQGSPEAIHASQEAELQRLQGRLQELEQRCRELQERAQAAEQQKQHALNTCERLRSMIVQVESQVQPPA